MQVGPCIPVGIRLEKGPSWPSSSASLIIIARALIIIAPCGGQVACAAGLATLDFIAAHGLVASSGRLGEVRSPWII